MVIVVGTRQLSHWRALTSVFGWLLAICMQRGQSSTIVSPPCSDATFRSSGVVHTGRRLCRP